MKARFIIAFAFAALLLVPFSASAQKGEKTVGVKAGYSTRTEAPIAGIYFQYRFSSHFAVSPNIEYTFRHRNQDAFIFNLDAQFPFAIQGSPVEVYPLAGISYGSWNMHSSSIVTDDVSTRYNRFGFNVGAGIDYKVTPSLVITARGRYNSVRRADSGIFTLGIGYRF